MKDGEQLIVRQAVECRRRRRFSGGLLRRHLSRWQVASVAGLHGAGKAHPSSQCARSCQSDSQRACWVPADEISCGNARGACSLTDWRSSFRIQKADFQTFGNKYSCVYARSWRSPPRAHVGICQTHKDLRFVVDDSCCKTFVQSSRVHAVTHAVTDTGPLQTQPSPFVHFFVDHTTAVLSHSRTGPARALLLSMHENSGVKLETSKQCDLGSLGLVGRLVAIRTAKLLRLHTFTTCKAQLQL